MARIAIPLLAVLALAGCTAAPAADDGRLHIVASTNVYGSIAESVGGDLVAVTSLIDSAAQDPHSFEASAQDQLAVSKADLVIENGGGYDTFVDPLLDAAASNAVIVTAADVVDLADGANEHLWYDLDAMRLVADDLATELGDLDPANAATFESNARALDERLAALATSAEGIGAGMSAAITEPVPLYLLEAAGFSNATPPEFSDAIEEGTDVPPAVLKEALDNIDEAALLAYNSQTASAETEKLRAAAESAGVPVVEFAETLPDGEDYISWMTANLAAITAALA